MSGRDGPNKLALYLSVLLFIAGLSIFSYPYINGFLTDSSMTQDARDFLSQLHPTEAFQNTTETPENGQDSFIETTPAREYAELWDAMQQYNQDIYEQGQSGLNSSLAYEVPSFCLTEYGLDSEVFGVISIPAIDVELPLYLGATEPHLADGAAHLSQTSLPIGGSNTNAVIAGHRGYSGAAYFRYVNELQPGDQVIITNPWDTLIYTVSEIQIISPNDVDAIHIQNDRDLLTLLTCHPYASGGKQRYLVICERMTNE